MEKAPGKPHVNKYPRGVDWTVSGVDPKLVIRSSPNYVIDGVRLGVLLEVEPGKSIQKFLKKLFRKRKA
jgi:hypothetical protein